MVPCCHLLISAAEADGSLISFAGIWPQTKRLHLRIDCFNNHCASSREEPELLSNRMAIHSVDVIKNHRQEPLLSALNVCQSVQNIKANVRRTTRWLRSPPGEPGRPSGQEPYRHVLPSPCDDALLSELEDSTHQISARVGRQILSKLSV